MEATQTIIINRIIATALKRKAADLHLSVGNNPVLRIDNKLHVLAEEEIITKDFLDNLAKGLLSGKELKELESTRGISVAHDYGNQVRFRINIFYQKNFLNFSFRFVAPVIPLIKNLGIPKTVLDLVNISEGLVIVGGPYDSGKTTTVFALLEEINKKQQRYILTIEKPIEFLMSSNRSIVVQRDIPKDARNYEEALDFCANEDVDIIMLDKLDISCDVLMKVFDLASSGRLVIGIMNEESVIGIIDKILSNFMIQDRSRARYLFANCLECVLAQKLVPRIGGGRILVPEILLATEPVKAIIKEDKTYQLNNILQTSREEGMRGIDRSLAELAGAGEISIDDAINYANNKEGFKRMLR
ncbi:MAG: ATPase, T2SS/T4P/T4SS family [bacterium]